MPRPVPTERNAKSSTPRATPCHCSPSAARLMSFTSVTSSPSRLARSSPSAMPSSSRKWVRPTCPSASTTPGTPTTTRPIRSRPAVGASISEPCTDSIAAIAASASAPPARRPGGRGCRRRGRRPRRGGSARPGRGRARAPRRGRARRRRLRAQPAGRCSDSRTRPASSSDCSASETVGFEMPGAARDLCPRDRRIGAHGLQHGALIQPLEQRRSCAVQLVSRHLVANPNGKYRLQAMLDADGGVCFTSYS